ncbi:hypothetical protein EON77_13945, partial [bacterium]
MRRASLVAAALAALVAVASTTAPRLAHADEEPEPESLTGKYSSYEQESIDAASESLGTSIDLDAEGKTLERVDIVTLEVFEKRDPIPRIANVLHVVTRPYVVAREVLLKVGAPYRRVVADEVARNLRLLPPLSLVIVVPMRGSAPDKVRLVIVTKDVWSLRASWNISVTPGGVENFLLQPSETNLFGTHHSVSATYIRLPESYTLGAGYAIPRLLGSRVAVSANAGLLMNSRRGEPEGSFGGLSVGQPLFSTRTKWAWTATGSWRNEVTRRYVNARLANFDALRTPADTSDDVPYQYRTDSAAASLGATRSFGWRTKNDFSVAVELSRRAYHTIDT